MSHLFIQILNAIGINILYFLPTCRVANIDDYMFSKVHPLRTPALCCMVCWARLRCSSYCCKAAENVFILSSAVIQEEHGEVGGRSCKCKEE